MSKAQKEQILEYLKKWKSITSWEAITKYRITRLADVIFKLRTQYEIVSIAETKAGKNWVRYVLLGKLK
jgi:hypothetical protein